MKEELWWTISNKMKQAKIEAIEHALLAKDRVEMGLEKILALNHPAPEEQEEINYLIASTRSSIDYECLFAEKLLSRINSSIKENLGITNRATIIDQKKFKALRKKNTIIDDFFNQMNEHIFPYFSQGDFAVGHGDTWRDNFLSFNGKLDAIDFDIVYRKIKPQHSLRYFLGTAIPDHQEREEWEPYFIEQCFERRYGDIEKNQEKYQQFMETYHRMDVTQTMLHVIRQLKKTKDATPDQAPATMQYLKQKTSELGLQNLYTSYEKLLQHYTESETFRNILFPLETLEDKLHVKSLQKTMQKEFLRQEKRNKNWKRVKKWGTIGAGLTALLGLATGGYSLATRGDFWRGMGFPGSDCQSTYNANFDVKSIILNGNKLSCGMDPYMVPSDSSLDVKVEFENEPYPPGLRISTCVLEKNSCVSRRTTRHTQSVDKNSNLKFNLKQWGMYVKPNKLNAYSLGVFVHESDALKFRAIFPLDFTNHSENSTSEQVTCLKDHIDVLHYSIEKLGEVALPETPGRDHFYTKPGDQLRVRAYIDINSPGLALEKELNAPTLAANSNEGIAACLGYDNSKPTTVF